MTSALSVHEPAPGAQAHAADTSQVLLAPRSLIDDGAADLQAQVRQDRPAVRLGRRRSRPLPFQTWRCSSRSTSSDAWSTAASRKSASPWSRASTAVDSKVDQLAQQGAGPGAGRLRVHRAPTSTSSRSATSGTGKTHIALESRRGGLPDGLMSRRRQVSFLQGWSANSTRPAEGGKHLRRRFQKKLDHRRASDRRRTRFAVALSMTGAELLFDVLSQRSDQCSTAWSPPIWPSTQLDRSVRHAERLTNKNQSIASVYHVNVHEMNGDNAYSDRTIGAGQAVDPRAS